VLLLGVSYKKDTGDVRESPALDIMRLLQQAGARVRFHDPYLRDLRLDGGRLLRATALTAANLRGADLVVIVTDHSAYDYPLIVRHARRVLDTRNATRDVRAGRAKIHKL
jgi:UDP-N-acetyl-D-glucosamine dehydrogenase